MAGASKEPFRLVSEGYDRIGERYREWSRGGPVRLAQLDGLLARLRPGSTVVELGCGPGEPVTRALAAAHTVLGVDASTVQLRLARRAAPGAGLVRADMTRLHLRPASVDAVAAFYSLGHVPAERHAPLFVEIATWLRPGGVLLASVPLGAGDGVEPGWLGVPMFFGGIGEGATRAAVASAGLVVERLERVREDEGGGKVVEFGWVTATKPAGSGPDDGLDDGLDDGVVRLRPWRDEDAAWYAACVRDPEIQRFTTDPATLDTAQVLVAVERMRRSPGEAGFVICDAAGGTRLGNIALSHDGREGEVSYWLAAEARGRGAATRALALFTAWAFRDVGLARLRLRAHRDNAASQRVALRAGYRRDPDRDGPQEAKGTVWPMLAYVRDAVTPAD